MSNLFLHFAVLLYFAPWQVEARVIGLLQNKSCGLTEAAHRDMANAVTLLLSNM